jgi:hypothetical protein
MWHDSPCREAAAKDPTTSNSPPEFFPEIIMFEQNAKPDSLLSVARSVTRRRGLIAVGLLAAVAFAGCSSEKRVPVYKVSGKVLYQGKPAAGAQVILHPAAGSSMPSDLAASATVQEDGSFQIGAYEATDGAPAGQYVATVQWFKLIQTEGGTGKGPNVVPAKYAAPATSPLQVSVQSGPTDLQAWDVAQ